MWQSLAVLFGLLAGLTGAARAGAPNPLTPLDTSSPRATLQGFTEMVDGVYVGVKNVLQGYDDSRRLYMTHEERRTLRDLLGRTPKIFQALDLSGISPVLTDTVALERAVQLKEVLDRIDVPALADVPDQDAMARLGAKRWRLPGTEIDLVRMEGGPRAGEYLVSAETVHRLPEFYDAVKTLPYKPGPALEVSKVYYDLTSRQSGTIYDILLDSPIGLAAIVPPRWLLSLPPWARFPVFGVSAWQWLGLGVGLCVGALFIVAAHHLGRRLAGRGEGGLRSYWKAVPLPVALIVVAALLVPVVCTALRIGGAVRVVVAYAATIVLSLSAAWLAIVGSLILGEVMVALEPLKRSSLEDQLIRLGMRLLGVICAITILVRGADELGFPAYSVVAGLGVGGLAVALAARDSIANLLGSMLLMVEKPFRIGDLVKIGGTEGTVETVGFRSTRIRTLDNSLITMPNDGVVNTAVENLSLRGMRRQRFLVGVTYATPRDKIEELIAAIQQLIVDHPLTDKTNFQVRFNNFSESSLDILVMFHLELTDYGDELREREVILFQIMDVAKELGVDFAFPTRTLQIESTLPTVTAKARQEA